MRVMKWVLFLLVLGNLAACNTVKGLGEDVQQAGQAIQNSADKNSAGASSSGTSSADK